MRKDVSFIIPVFNTDKDLLARCLDSIRQQNLIDFEIIVVNDGSEVLKSKEYEKLSHDYGARYYYQEKQGVSVARNKGIEEAQGKYIFFVDSDDKLISNSISKQDISNNEDFIIYNVEKINNKSNDKKTYTLGVDVSSPPQMKIINGFLNNDLLNWSVSKLYKRSFLIKNNIKFDSKRVSGEDFVFVYAVYKNEPIVKYVKKNIYIYYYNDVTGESRILSKPIANVNDIMTLYHIRNEIIDSYEYLGKDIKITLCQNTIDSLFSSYSLIVSTRLVKNAEIFSTYANIAKNFEESILAEIRLKYKLKLFLMTHKSKIATKLYNKLFLIKVWVKGKDKK